MLFLLLSVNPPTATRADGSDWPTRLSDCGVAFVDAANAINDTYHQGGYTETERNDLLNFADTLYTQCLDSIDVPTEDPNFCAQARAARDQCNAELGDVEGAWGARYECIMKSGVSQCE